jgi:hypothetical protein
MSTLGKILVLINFTLSLLFFGWAVAVYFNQVDWGWKDPRKELDARVPSEIDKRLVVIKEALRARERMAADLKLARDALTYYEPRLYQNRLWYHEELNRLRSAPKTIQVWGWKIGKDGRPELDQTQFGQPAKGPDVVFTNAKGKPVAVDRSYDTYRAQLAVKHGEVEKVQERIRDLIEKQEKITLKLNGVKDDKGVVVRPGLYVLRDHEDDIQKRVTEETEYLRPLWVRELVDAQLLVERRQLLEERLAELKALLAADR